MKILDAAQMRNIDRRTTESFGIPSIVLMENAAVAVADVIAAHYPAADRVAIFCGTGANGGDGFALARHLESRGVVPVVIVVGDRARIAGDSLTNFLICQRLGLPIYDVAGVAQVDEALVQAAGTDLLVDAIFGTGLDRAPSGLHADIITGMAEMRLPVVAVDLPSGLNASSSIPFEPCIHAEMTVTFAAPKICHVFDPAATFCGEIVVAGISIPDAAMEEENVTLSMTTIAGIQPLVAPRLAATHKGTYGHVGIVAGSPGRSGAAVLAARAAIRTGAGLVTVVTDSDTARLVSAGSIESMTYSGDDAAGFLRGKAAVLIGPGLADDERSYASTRDLLPRIDVPLVIDASALNAFAGRTDLINPAARPRVITPHPGELGRLLGQNAKAINESRIASVREAARACNCVVVLKGHQTLIADPEGHVQVNPTGNPGMASGGMGDVLSGIVAAFLARGVDPFEAACAAVYLHGFAGDLLEEESGDIGLAALDLVEKIPSAIQRLRDA